jgi:hypothetical protein
MVHLWHHDGWRLAWCSSGSAWSAVAKAVPHPRTPASLPPQADASCNRWVSWTRTRVTAVYERLLPTGAVDAGLRVSLMEREDWDDRPPQPKGWGDEPGNETGERVSSFARDVLLVTSIVTPETADWRDRGDYDCTCCGRKSSFPCGCGADAVREIEFWMDPAPFFLRVIDAWHAAPGNREYVDLRYPITHAAGPRRRPWAEEVVAVALHPARPHLWASTTAADDDMHGLDDAAVASGSGWLRAALAHASPRRA